MSLYLSLSSDLHDCLILRKWYSLFTEVGAFMLLLQESFVPVLQLAVATSWMPGNDTVCAFLGGAPEGRRAPLGRGCVSSRFRTGTLLMMPLVKVPIILMTNAGEQTDHCQNRGLSVIAN